MKTKDVFIWIIAGIIIAAIVGTAWLIIGSLFVSGFIVGAQESITGQEIELTFKNYLPGLIIVIIQTLLTITLLILAVYLSLPSKHQKYNPVHNGMWLFVIALLIFVVNPLQILTSVSLVVAGVIAGKIPKEEQIDYEPRQLKQLE